jgi:hypothetical protein
VSFTAPMSRRRKVLVTVVGIGLILFGAATLWQGNDGGVPRYARVLLLDPATGKTLHERKLDAGYAIAALLSGGRVAVATEDSCPDQRGGRITVFAASLTRVLSTRTVYPCTVAQFNVDSLRTRFQPDRGPLPRYAEDAVTVRLGAGKIVETYSHGSDGAVWLSAMAAFDGSGRPLWQRSDLGHIGVVDVRDGRVLVPVLGTFTPGSD